MENKLDLLIKYTLIENMYRDWVEVWQKYQIDDIEGEKHWKDKLPDVQWKPSKKTAEAEAWVAKLWELRNSLVDRLAASVDFQELKTIAGEQGNDTK